MTPSSCAACGVIAAHGSVAYRFSLVVQGEQIQRPGGEPGGESAESLLAAMSAEGDWERYESDVHQSWEGLLCPSCRDELRTWLAGRQAE